MKNYYVNVKSTSNPFPLLLSGSSGCLIDTITGDTNGGFELSDITVIDNFGNSFDAPAVSTIHVVSQVPVLSVESPINSCLVRIRLQNIFPINLVNRFGCVIDTITSNPPSGNYLLPAAAFNDDNGFFSNAFIGNAFNIIGGKIQAITNTNSGCDTNIILEPCDNPFPISIINSEGCKIDTIEEAGDIIDNEVVLPDSELKENNTLITNVAAPKVINIIGANILSATTSQEGCQLDITVEGGVVPSDIIPRRLTWQGQQTEYTPGDTGYWYQQGAYTINDGPGLIQDLDWNAVDPNNIFYLLKYPNIFGGNRRFTTSTGIAAGGSTPAHFNTGDWDAEVAAGGIDRYVIDHLTGLGYLISKVVINEDWFDSVAAVHSLNYGRFTDWRPLTRVEAESVIPFGINSQFYNQACILTRGDFFVTGNETRFWLGDTRANITTAAMTVWDSGDVRNQSKSAGSILCSIFAVRNHF